MIPATMALLIIAVGALPCLLLAAYRILRIIRRRRSVSTWMPVSGAASCVHMSFTAGCQVAAVSCGQCGPLPVTVGYARREVLSA